MHLPALLVQLYMEGTGGEESVEIFKLTCSPKQYLWLLLWEVSPRRGIPFGSLTCVLKSAGNQYA